jgi:hypothetical protein
MKEGQHEIAEKLWLAAAVVPSAISKGCKRRLPGMLAEAR